MKIRFDSAFGRWLRLYGGVHWTALSEAVYAFLSHRYVAWGRLRYDLLETAFGGQRSLDELEDDLLPRIC
jgi:hypothetical protein